MNYIKKLLGFLPKVTATQAVIGVLVLGFIGYTLFFKGGGIKEETLVVAPGPFVQQVSVSGKVVAAQDVDLGFSQSGRVSRVYGKVGNTVPAGAVLAEIENGDLYAAVLQRQAALESQQAKLQSVKDGTRPEKLAVAQSSVDSAVSALVQANQGVVNAIVDAYAKSDDAIHNKVDQFITNPRSLNPQLMFPVSDSQLASNLLSARVAIEITLQRSQKDTTIDPASSELLAVAARAQGNIAGVAELLNGASAVLNRAITGQVVSQATINTYISDVGAGRTAVSTSNSSLNTAITAQKNAAAALDSARKNLALEQAGSTSADITVEAAQVKAAQADLQNAQAQLGKTRIVAPFTGIITKVDAKVGEIVSSNTSGISLIGKGAFQIESFVPEIHVALVALNDPAKVTLDAYGSETPFSAKIVSIDPAETVQDGVSTYRAILQFTTQDPRIKSGMTANVQITTEEKQNVISVPQGIIIDREGKKYIRVKTAEGIVEREVEVGSVSSSGNIEILSGLTAGEVVMLST